MASGYDPTDLRGQDRDRREADMRERNARRTEIADLRWLMSTPRGRRFMWRILAMAKTFQPSFSTNAMQMSFNEGMRNLGTLFLQEVMEQCLEQFPVMQKEQLEKEQHDGRRDGSGDSQSNT